MVLRLRIGPAYLSATLGQQDLPAEQYAGAGFAFDAEIGGSLTSTVTACFEVSGMLAPNAKADNSGTTLTGAPTVDLEKASLGASFTYTNPSNIYFAANPALTILRLTNHYPRDYDSSFIAALAVEVGSWSAPNGAFRAAGDSAWPAKPGSPVCRTVKRA